MTAAAPDAEIAKLEAAAHDLGTRQVVSTHKPTPLPAWAELRAVPEWLERARLACAEAGPEVAKAAEWLLDNDYLVERAVEQIGQDLPAGYYARLPAVASENGTYPPRVYGLARHLLEVSQLQLSPTAAIRFVNAYQEDDALTIGELWAFPTMLRLACLELLLCSFERLIPKLAVPWTPSLAEAPGSLDDTECIARSLANLRICSSIRWKDFFAETSRVEAILRSDPAGVYDRMDFDTRDRYRKAVEWLAAGGPVRAEPDVSARAVERAQVGGSRAAAAHVGFWLVGEGREEFERSLGHRAARSIAFGRWMRSHAGPLYATALAASTLAVLALVAIELAANGATPGLFALGIAVTAIPASVLAVTLVHWVATQLVPPATLPKLDFETGVPPDCKTAVVMPLLVAGAREARDVLDQLERHFVANPDPSLLFALLTDHSDAPAEHMPGDEDAVHALVDGIRGLNARHGRSGARFLLLHRARRHNPAQGCWMGWERKRGKLEELNSLIAGDAPTGFAVHEGDLHALRGIRFVVTVDADTILPPGSVARLVATLAHPLNRAEFDERSGRVRAGYTIVQPRVEIAPESSGASLFARLASGDTSIDIYTRAVSSVYQDLFGSGIYVGKGIYEVEAFRRSVAGRMPENALASHDLIEGIHGRVALASDVVFYEGFPSQYTTFVLRWHRWVRGDWQLLPWLGRRVPGPDGRVPTPFSLLERWQIADNLRRSLIAPAVLVLFASGWLLLPGNPWFWTGLGTAVPGAAFFAACATALRGIERATVQGSLRDLREQAGRWMLALAFLAHEAGVAVDAVLRTTWRVYVSSRHLLQWLPAAHAEARASARESRAARWRRMPIAPLVSIGLAAAVALLRPEALAAAAPLLLLWLVSPELADLVSRPRPLRTPVIPEKDRAFLRAAARRTWLFFETFVGPEDHWLPPDNYQEEPHGDVAHRTSPTNVGMMLLSSAAACDLGYLGLPELAARLRNSLDTLERLERHRGHVLNWYDTRSLEPLEPRYVSTVDSGNLAVSLVTLGGACREFASGPVVGKALWNGLTDLLGLLTQALEGMNAEATRPLHDRFAVILDHVARARQDPASWRAALHELCERECPAVEALLMRAIDLPVRAPTEVLHEVRIWLERLRHHMRAMQRDVETMLPWLAVLDVAPPAHSELARELRELLPPSLTFAETDPQCARARARLADAAAAAGDDASRQWLTELGTALEKGLADRDAVRRALLDIAARADAQADAMEFGSLFDTELRLFHIGYNVSADRLDPHHYDLLATEARLASFFAIAKGDVPLEHWFFLGRPVTRIAGQVALVSWGGSMFEYLMPALLLRSGSRTLLAQSERAAVVSQQQYAATRRAPWGVSESGYAARDPDDHYRYRAFGVPGLGLRRGLSRDLVVAPYATALALTSHADAAVENLRELARLGVMGRYGFYEAADFTPERVPEGRRFTVVRSYMAHHQGMILAAIENALQRDALVRWFHADRRVRAFELLLHERIPRELPPEIARTRERAAPIARRLEIPATPTWTPDGTEVSPQVQVLGNGRLATWISEAGAGALHWHQWALTRFLPDATCDDHGTWIYVCDEESGALWSATRQPTRRVPDESHVLFHAHLAEFHRRDDGIAIGLDVAVATGDDIEMRRIGVVNESDRPRTLLFTSYAEVALAPQLDDERHPAFAKLFVHTEWIPSLQGILFSRRPRDPGERPPFFLHRVLSDGDVLEITGFDTDRGSFLGRHGDVRRPPGARSTPSGSAGFTLDPVMAIQVRVQLEPGERRSFAFLTLAAGSQQSLQETAERHATLASLDWVVANAANESAREVQALGLDPRWLPQLQAVASLLVHPHPALRAAPRAFAENELGQARLWGLGISGDLPLLLLRAGDSETDLLNILVSAHQLWRRHGLMVDLVIVRTGASGYEEPLRDAVNAALREAGAHEMLGRKGGIHLLFADQIREDEQRLLDVAARVRLDTAKGSLDRQFSGLPAAPSEIPRLVASRTPESPGAGAAPIERSALLFENGFGGFTSDGRAYVIELEAGRTTPAPWCNVLANDTFGSVVTESGGGFTWSENSGENRLTPWTCDALADPPGEALYLRDEETAEIWTVTPEPAGHDAPCQVRHGAGYTEWRRTSHGLEQELLTFVPLDDPVKVMRLRLRNLSGRPRRTTVTCYAEWLLGALRSVARCHVVSDYDAVDHALLARNPWNSDFAERVAFLSSSRPPHGLSADRCEFLGREGSLRRPAALERWGLSGRVGPGADPCAVYQVHLDLDGDATCEVVFALGQGRDRAHALELVRRWQDGKHVESALAATSENWDRVLGAVRVRTPDPAFDLMTNRWLLQQTIASRVFARAGFYQAGGAIGFRDQLQDVLALLHADPARVRAHLLTCAAHQFEEGDVLHWWHPPADRGVRTRCSDDLLWLTYATCCYVDATGDDAVLDEAIPFLRAAPLGRDEHARYARFEPTREPRSLFEHCERALERGVTRGAHGLPLIGSGDWNDGMDRVGRRGRGESVWLSWFALDTIERFAALCERRSRSGLAERWRSRAKELAQAVEESAWDGAWYRRAFDDDGQPWGSASGDECRIDSIAQSWAALSKAAVPERARSALASAERELVRAEEGVIRLLWPPFDVTPRDPGYIKAYPPGIRENGGQYTHAAAWLGLAFAAIGDRERAWRIRRLLDPIGHAATREAAERYAVEPYVLAADVGAVTPHLGRGGWTWYTGSAAWTWRLGVEGLLGLRLSRGRLTIDPCLPREWDGYEAEVRGPAGTLSVRVEDPDRVGMGVTAVFVDGVPHPASAIDFPSDGSVRHVAVRLGPAATQDAAES